MAFKRNLLGHCRFASCRKRSTVCAEQHFFLANTKAQADYYYYYY
jgi:hypothetical protein